jgi:hypothetical protein
MTISTATTAGQILTSAYVNNNINSGMQVVKTQTVGSGVSTVTVSSCFSASYNNYKIMYTGGQGSTALDISLQLTGITTGVYYGSIIHASAAPGAASVAGVSGATSWTYCGMMRSPGAGGMFDVDLYSPFDSTSRTRIHAPYIRSDDQSYGTFTGVVESTVSATGFTLGVSTGNLTGGTIVVYGYRIP